MGQLQQRRVIWIQEFEFKFEFKHSGGANRSFPAGLCIYICICTYVYIYIYILIYVHVHVYIIHIYTYIWHVHVYIIHIYTYIYLCLCSEDLNHIGLYVRILGPLSRGIWRLFLSFYLLNFDHDVIEAGYGGRSFSIFSIRYWICKYDLEAILSSRFFHRWSLWRFFPSL